MYAERGWFGPLKWWISGSAAVCIHGAVLFTLPDMPSSSRVPAPAAMQPVWLSIASASADAAPDSSAGGRSGASAGASPVTAHAAAAPANLPTRRRAPRVRAPAAPAVESGQAGVAQAQASPVLQPETSPALQPQTSPALQPETSLARGSETSPALQPETLAVPQSSAGGTSAAWGSGLAAGGMGGGAHGATRAASRGRRPGLLAAPNPCGGYFPAAARADHGEVQIAVHVDASGQPRISDLLTESPRGQGFGSAARACAAALRFVPALDERGTPIEGDAKLALRFDRS